MSGLRRGLGFTSGMVPGAPGITDHFTADWIVDYTGPGATPYIVIDGDSGIIVSASATWNAAMQWAVDNLSAYGGFIFNKPVAGADCSAPVVIDDRNSIRILGAAPCTVTDAGHTGMGATQINCTQAAARGAFEVTDCESIEIGNFYLYTGEVDNYGILVSGTNVVPEHIYIHGNNIRRFLHGIHFTDMWGSNVGGVMERNHITAANVGDGTGLCVHSEDLNHWGVYNNVFSGNGQTGNCWYMTEGDSARHVRIAFINNQWIAAYAYHLRINVPSVNGRATAISFNTDNFETVSAGNGIASIWIEGVKSRAVLGFYDTIHQNLGGHEALQVDAVEGVVHVHVVGSDGFTPILNNNGVDTHIWVKHSYGDDPSENEGDEYAVNNMPGTVMTAGATRYVPIQGFLAEAAAEATAQMEIRRDKMLKTLRVYATPGANNSTVTLRVNGAPSAITCTVTGGAGIGWFEDLVNEVAVVRGDDICYDVTSGAGGQTIYGIYLEYKE